MVILNTFSLTKCSLWVRDIKLIFSFDCYYIYLQDKHSFFEFLVSVINHYHIHHHPHVVPPAWISLTLSRHFSLSFIAFGRSSGLHPVSSNSCYIYVRAGRPAFALPYAGSTSLMSSALLLQQCPPCLVRLTCIVLIVCIYFETVLNDLNSK